MIPLQLNLCLVCKYDINEVCSNYSIPFFQGERPWTETSYRGGWVFSKYWQHSVCDNQCLKRTGHQKPSLSLSVKELNPNTNTWHILSVRLLDVNHISMFNSCKYLNQSRGHQEETHCLRKHIMHLTHSCLAYFIIYIMGIIRPILKTSLTHILLDQNSSV